MTQSGWYVRLSFGHGRFPVYPCAGTPARWPLTIRRSILYVDDDPAQLEVFGDLFGSDYDVRATTDPGVALRVLPASSRAQVRIAINGGRRHERARDTDC